MMSTTQTHSRSRRKEFDVQFLKTLPGIFLLVQLACVFLGFLVGLFNPFYKSFAHVFFLLVMSAANFTTCSWILVHFCELKSSRLLKGIDWNKAGMVHSGTVGVLVMIGSIVMIDWSYNSRSLKAAGVFGFLSFSAYLVHFSWEMTRYIESTLPPGAVVTATMARGEEVDTISLPDNDDSNVFCEKDVVGTTYNPRSKSPATLELRFDEAKMINKPSNLVDSDSFDSDSSASDQQTKKYNFTNA